MNEINENINKKNVLTGFAPSSSLAPSAGGLAEPLYKPSNKFSRNEPGCNGASSSSGS